MEKYNGWTNYETWRINLELCDGVTLEDLGLDNDAEESEVHDCLKEMVDNAITQHGEIPEDSLAVSYADAFVNAVNYWEIAKAVIEYSNDQVD